MTFEEFESLALNPPHRDEETIFEVIEYDINPLPERKRCHYPRFDVYKSRSCFAHTLQDAEALMQKAIERASEFDEEIYCFHIKEFPVGENIHRIGVDLGISCRLYDGNGALLDRTYCSYLDRDFGTEYGRFRGRPENSRRIKPGDIVEILNEDEVILAVAVGSNVSIERCWEQLDYVRDCSDDQITVIDGPYGSHDHISPIFIQHPRFPISKTLSLKLTKYASKYLISFPSQQL